jgi:nitrite reductase (NADH) small subunit
MAAYIKVAEVGDIPNHSGRRYDVADRQIALFHLDDNYYAIDNLCSHAGGPLADGSLEGTRVTCPWHAWEYDLTNGACLTNPNATQAYYPVKIDGNDILVAV